ncbi:MAG: tetratricopeptide repeat protein [Alphaproteobacteria bacterium]|nr:tetratricopeptide repeat protein [Alphaproteobacteria bacterium]
MSGHKEKSVAEAFAEAMNAYQNGNGAEARRLAKRIADHHPTFGGAHYLLGLLSLDRAQGKQAAGHLAKAITITPRQPVLHMAMGRALELTGDVAEACLHFRTVLGLMPHHAEAHARLGNGLRLLGKRDEAMAQCREAVAQDPAHADAWNCLAGLLQEAGQPAEAAEAARKALALRPDWPAALNNYGVALKELGRLTEAAVILEGAVELRPSHAGARANLAAVYRALDRLADARSQAEAGTRADPRHAESWMELGLVRQALKHSDGAAAAFERAVAAKPDLAKAWFCLGEARRQQNKPDLARKAYGHYLVLDPADHCGAALGLALAGGTNAPAKPPEAYVRKLFDDYAERFDDSLVGKLEYRAPTVLGQALAEVLGPVSGLDVVDIGCGTGLAAPVLKPLAGRLDGVDLSPAMIAKAAERGLYDHLETGDVVAYLEARPGSVDLVAAADVLVYLGDLEPIFVAAAKALRDGGTLAFTAEKNDERAWVLGPTQRYAHSPAYIRAHAEAAGFTVALLEDAVTRHEAGQPVPGLVAVLRKS